MWPAASRSKSTADTNPGDIAIIGRKHKSLELIAPYLAQYGRQG